MTPEEIDKLEAGPELDRLIAEKIMGWERIPSSEAYPFITWKGPDGFDCYSAVFSRQIFSAWMVVEKLKAEKYSISIYCVGNPEDGHLAPDKEWGCQIYHKTRESNHHCILDPPHENSRFFVFASALTAPEAICRAALKTIGGKD